jgi:hypothetical protein
MYPLYSAQRNGYESQIEIMRSDIEEWDKRQDVLRRGKEAGNS